MTTKIFLRNLLLISAILMCSCEKIAIVNKPKEERIDQETVTKATDVSGSWLWLYSYSGGNPSSEGFFKSPENTGVAVNIVFNSDKSWYKTQNNIKTDSGSYSIGHGIYTPYIGAYVFTYDSIIYSNTVTNTKSVDFYKIFHDTLIFSGGFRGLYTKSDPTEGATKYYIKVK